jgi:hypothetical protein
LKKFLENNFFPSENTKEKFTGKNEKNSEEYSKPLISSMDIKCALRDYLNTELGNKNNLHFNNNSKLKLNNEELEPKDSNEKLKKNENRNKIISSYSDIDDKNFNSSERELLDRIRRQEGKGGYVKNKLRRLVFAYLFFLLFYDYFGADKFSFLYRIALLCFQVTILQIVLFSFILSYFIYLLFFILHFILCENNHAQLLIAV